MTEPFPNDDTLCEACGYPMKGLTAEGMCPECGAAVKESSPAVRIGLPWQHEGSLRSFIKTVWMVAAQPRQSFRKLDLGPATRRDDAFLFIFALGLGVIAAVLWQFTTYSGRWGSPLPWLWGASTSIAIVVLTWTEAAGLTYFSKRHGWRVPWRVAQRVAAFSAVGWVPGVAALFVLMVVNERGIIRAGMPPNWQVMWDFVNLPVFVAVMGVSIMWFETLVWLGVRQVRYGNWSVEHDVNNGAIALDGHACEELT